jgi:hypothetical protein
MSLREISEKMVEAAGVELSNVLTPRKLLILGNATTAKKSPIAQSVVRLLYENAFRLGVHGNHGATASIA